jgi:hypothetical protein
MEEYTVSSTNVAIFDYLDLIEDFLDDGFHQRQELITRARQEPQNRTGRPIREVQNYSGSTNRKIMEAEAPEMLTRSTMSPAEALKVSEKLALKKTPKPKRKPVEKVHFFSMLFASFDD